MTAEEALTSLKNLYKDLMFKQNWTMADVDNMDRDFFYSLFEDEEKERKLYIDQIGF